MRESKDGFAPRCALDDVDVEHDIPGRMKRRFTRRTWVRTLLASTATAFPALHSHAQGQRRKAKITDVKAMQVANIAGNCLIRIDTDAGLTGYGEAGVSGPMARARIAQFKPMLVGQDPLSIERHFQNLT